MGVFVYEYPHIGGNNEGPAPWGRMVHSLTCHRRGWRDSTNGDTVYDLLATLRLCSELVLLPAEPFVESCWPCPWQIGEWTVRPHGAGPSLTPPVR